ncbi:MAG: hypothetical protein K2R98_05585 [Gemmataceae bacterium]|nr:hypothetical protein [Gemmataceae bacterium]
MSRYCSVCRQAFADELVSCPRCQALGTVNGNGKVPAPDATPVPFLQRRMAPAGAQPAENDAEIDLGSPVHGRTEDGGPPSGASFVCWSSYLAGKNDGPPSDSDSPIHIGTPSQAQLLLGSAKNSAGAPGPTQSKADDAEIDLGGPVQSGTGDDGPPSGASFVSWEALLRSRKDFDNDASGASASDPAISPPGGSARLMLEGRAPVPTVPRVAAPIATVARSRSWFSIVILGVGLGFVVCMGLWLAGFEPPQQWRQQLNQWIGRAPPSSNPQ